MKIFKKVAIIGGIAFVVIVLAIGIAIKVFVDKDLVAKLIEDNINGRVEIEDISVPLWAAFSGITIDGFKIGYKDAEMKKPMNERAKMANNKVVLGFEQFNFSVAIGKLIMSGGKEFQMKSLLLKKPKVNLVIGKNGGNNLTGLLVKKKTKEQIEAEKKEAAEAKEEAKKKKKEKKEPKEKSKPFNIKDLDTEIKMSKIGLVDGIVTVNLKKSGQTIILTDLDLLVKDISIDPKNLAKKNRVTINAGFTAALKESKRKGVKSFRVIFDSNTTVKPFNEKTGRVSENAHVKVGLLKGTKITGLAIFNKIKSGTAQLKKVGVNLDFLGDTLELNKDAWAGVKYAGGKVTFDEPPALVTKDMTITLKKGDYFHSKTMKHKLTPTVILASKHSDKINKQVEKEIDKTMGKALKGVKLPGGIKAKFNASDVRKKLLAPAQNKNGQFEIVALSTKKIADPNVKIIKPKFGSVGDMVGGSLKGLNIGGLASAGLNKAKNFAKKKAKEQVEKAKKQASERGKKEVNKLLKKQKLPF